MIILYHLPIILHLHRMLMKNYVLLRLFEHVCKCLVRKFLQYQWKVCSAVICFTGLWSAIDFCVKAITLCDKLRPPLLKVLIEFVNMRPCYFKRGCKLYLKRKLCTINKDSVSVCSECLCSVIDFDCVKSVNYVVGDGFCSQH